MNRPFLLGLTGSIGMGKSTTAKIFADAGVPVWDADATVHRLYAPGGAAARALSDDFPEAVMDGAVDRGALKMRLAKDPGALALLESRIHPLVAADRQDFVARARMDGAKLVVLDIPLLFETGADQDVDATVVVTAPPEVQRARVLARDDMTPDHLEHILSRQMSDAEKRRRATYVIATETLEQTRRDVEHLIRELDARV